MSIDTNEMREACPHKRIQYHNDFHALCDEIDALRARVAELESDEEDFEREGLDGWYSLCPQCGAKTPPPAQPAESPPTLADDLRALAASMDAPPHDNTTAFYADRLREILRKHGEGTGRASDD